MSIPGSLPQVFVSCWFFRRTCQYILLILVALGKNMYIVHIDILLIFIGLGKDTYVVHTIIYLLVTGERTDVCKKCISTRHKLHPLTLMTYVTV